MVTVRVARWFYYIPRAKLTIIEGVYETSEDIDKAVRRGELETKIAEIEKQSRFIHHPYKRPPRFFELTCHPEDLLRLAELVKRVCE